MKIIFSRLMLGFSLFFLSQSSIAMPLELAKEARQLAKNNQLKPALRKSLAALEQFNRQFNQRQANQKQSHQKQSHQKQAHHHSHGNPFFLTYLVDDIAAIYYRLGEFSKALPYAQQAYQLALNLPDSNNKPIAIAHIAQNHAAINYTIGNIDQAEAYYLKSYQLYKKIPTQAKKAAVIAVALVTLYLDKNEAENASKFIDESLSILAKNPDKQLLFNQYLNKVKLGININNEKVIYDGLSSAKNLLPDLNQASTLKFSEINARALLFQSRLPEAKTWLYSIIDEQQVNTQLDKTAVANAYYYLGFVYILQGKVIEAEPMVLAALQRFRKLVGVAHPVVGRALHQLAIINKNIGRLQESEQYYLQALQVFEKAFKEHHETIGATNLEYSLLLSHQGRYKDAENQSRKAIAIFANNNQPLHLGYSHSSLGFAQFEQNHFKEAKASFKKAIKLMRSARGEQSADLPPGLIKLAEIALLENRYKSAEKYINRAISLLKSMEANSPYGLIKALSVKSRLMHKKGKHKAALTLSENYLALLKNRLVIHRNSIVNLALEEQREVRKLFKDYIDINYPSGANLGLKKHIEPLFLASQYPHMTATSSAMGQVANRIDIKDKNLADLLSRRNTLVEQWIESQQNQVKKLAGMSDTAINIDSESIQKEIIQIDQQLDRDYPSFAELTNPEPVDITDIQNALKDDEALFLQVTEKNGTVVFYIDNSSIHINKSDLMTDELTQRVNNIRYSLDLTRSDISSYAKLPRFEVEDAYFLYQKLFQAFEPQLSKKKVLITILDGAMQNIPPAVLVKKTQNRSGVLDYRKTDFLGHSLGFSIFPDASSFVTLRKRVKNNQAEKKFLGIGDPDLDVLSAETRSFTLTLDTIAEQIFKHNNPSVLRSLFTPLPKTKIELSLIANFLDATDKDLILGKQATEKRVKSLPLDNYKVISFATHGLLAGEFRGLMEPALVLTPPSQGSKVDDGLLMASEIAGLTLNADLVLLSACNTAGPSGRPGAEGLSGLSKAFFYSGARSLLVSHWAIDSTSAAFLTTRMMQHVQKRNISKAKALQVSMRELAFENKLYFAHPAFWSPFVIVGGA